MGYIFLLVEIIYKEKFYAGIALKNRTNGKRTTRLLRIPLSGSWLNMVKSILRIIKRRALDGQHPHSTDEIISWLENMAKGWNKDPTPFTWGGKRADRRKQQHTKKHKIGGSGAVTLKPVYCREN